MPLNPKISWESGWKVEEHCPGSGSQYIQCMNDIGYSQDDMITDITNLSNDSIILRTIYVGWNAGLAQFLCLDVGMITNSVYSTMSISLNNSLSYQILIMDPKIQILSEIPTIYPITRLSFPVQYVGVLQVYLQVHISTK